MVVFQTYASLAAVVSLALAADPGSYVRMESMRGESMAGMLLSSDGLAEMERQMSGEIIEMQQSAASAIKQRAEKLQDFVRDTKQRYLTAREAVSHSLAGLADSVASRWRRLTVASFHERLGKCCCSRNVVDGCEWQPFKLGGPIVDYECKIGFMDYMDAITARSMEGASSNTSEVDNILDQCAASKGWQYQSWDWSPPAANISMPGEIVAVPPVPIVALHHLETSVVVSDVVKPTDDLIVAVPEDSSESHQPAEKEISSGAPREALQPNETALDLDVETVSSAVKDIVGLPDEKPSDQAPKVEESQEKHAEGMDELDRAAAELAAAERAVSLLPSSDQIAPGIDASAQQLVQSDPAAAVEVNASVVPNVVPIGWTKAQPGQQDSDRGAGSRQHDPHGKMHEESMASPSSMPSSPSPPDAHLSGKSSLQKRQIMQASGDTGHALEDERRRLSEKNAGRRHARDDELFRESVRKLNALQQRG